MKNQLTHEEIEQHYLILINQYMDRIKDLNEQLKDESLTGLVKDGLEARRARWLESLEHVSAERKQYHEEYLARIKND